MPKTKQTPKQHDLSPSAVENTQRRILLDLMHHDALTFNRLWNKQAYSNQFAYHLKALQTQGLIQKTANGYSLTSKGKEQVAYLARETGKQWQFPIVAVITVIMDKNKVLVLERAQEPFLGYFGFHGGKLASDQYLLECAQQSIAKETGLRCHVELKGLFSSKTYEGDKLLYNHQLFVVKAMKPKGRLITKTQKGTNTWTSQSDLKKLKILPNIPLLLKIAQGKRFRWIEADRTQNGALSLHVKKDKIL